MALMIAELYDALKDAGADESKARKAAETVADYAADIRILKWGQTATFTILLVLLASQAGLWIEFAKVNGTLGRVSTQVEQIAQKLPR